MRQAAGLEKSTTCTALKKLCEKGFAQNEASVVSALIPRDRVQAYESERFVEHAFQGSLPGFLAAFLGGKTLSAQEAAELKQLAVVGEAGVTTLAPTSVLTYEGDGKVSFTMLDTQTGQYTQQTVQCTIRKDGSAHFVATSTPVQQPLDAAVSQAILDYNRDRYPTGDLLCESHLTLDVRPDEASHSVTVYALALYLVCGQSGGAVDDLGGSYEAVAITLRQDADSYVLTDYWEPSDGSDYVPSLRERFPEELVEDALNAQQSLLPLMQSCYAQAVAALGLDTDAIAEGLVEEICSSPAASSRPADYLEQHAAKYRELLFYGDYTLSYVFDQFLAGGQTGLQGQILRKAMDDLTGEGIDLTAETGQAYFDAWLQSARDYASLHGSDALLETRPHAYQLLRSLNELPTA